MSKPVVRWETGEVFGSASAAARAVGTYPSNIARAVRNRTAAGGSHWYWQGDPKPAEGDFRKRGDGRGVSVACWETGEVFGSIRLAAKHAGCSAPSISKAVAGGFAAGGLHWYRAGGPRPDESQLRRPRELRVACCETGDVFESVNAAADWAEGRASDVSEALATELPYRGFHWMALGERGRREGRPVVCVETGERFERVIDAVAAVGGNKIGVGRALRNGTEYAGYHWGYAD